MASCSKKEEVEQNLPLWNPVENHIAILFGYGYNDKTFVDSICNNLAVKYGLESEDGLILPLVYPDDFIVQGSVARISNLLSLIVDKKCKALITLGAPEYTHRTLAKIQDENIDCTVISLFSQDDILGTEAGSYLVFDFTEDELILTENSEQTANLSSQDLINLTNDTQLKHLDKMNFIVSKVVELLETPLLMENKDIPQIATNIFGSDWEVSSFLDADTGLRARNHFVLKYIEPVVEVVNEDKEKSKNFFQKLITK